VSGVIELDPVSIPPESGGQERTPPGIAPDSKPGLALKSRLQQLPRPVLYAGLAVVALLGVLAIASLGGSGDDAVTAAESAAPPEIKPAPAPVPIAPKTASPPKPEPSATASAAPSSSASDPPPATSVRQWRPRDYVPGGL
jgi:hypothetical protein